MARIDTLSNFLTDVSSAIKQKTGGSSPIPASSFDTEILSITTGGTYQTKSQSIATNGNYIITPDTGYDAIEQLNLSVAVPIPRQSVKKFDTVTDLNNDPDKQDNDWAMVIKDTTHYLDSSTTFNNMRFAEQVTLPTTVVGTEINHQLFHADSSASNAPYATVVLNATNFIVTIYNHSSGTIVVTYDTTDSKTYTLRQSCARRVDFDVNMICNYPEYWDNRVSQFIGYDTTNFEGIYKYEPLYTQATIPNYEKMEWWIYEDEHIDTSRMVLYHNHSIYAERSVLYEFFNLCQNWSIITPGAEPWESNKLFVSTNADRTILHGYTRVVPRTNYYELQGLDYDLNYYHNNSYVKATASNEQGLAEMRLFSYNIQTKEFTVSNWTTNLIIGASHYMLFPDHYVLGNLYSCGPNDTYWRDHFKWYFHYLKDDATAYNDLLYSDDCNNPYFFDTTIPTYNKRIDGYDISTLTADASQVTIGKTFIGANRC